MNLIEVLIQKTELLPLNYNSQSIFKSDKVTKLQGNYRDNTINWLCHMFHLQNNECTDMLSRYIYGLP